MRDLALDHQLTQRGIACIEVETLLTFAGYRQTFDRQDIECPRHQNEGIGCQRVELENLQEQIVKKPVRYPPPHRLSADFDIEPAHAAGVADAGKLEIIILFQQPQRPGQIHRKRRRQRVEPGQQRIPAYPPANGQDVSITKVVRIESKRLDRIAVVGAVR